MDATADELAKVYLKIRDRRAKLKREFEKENEGLEVQQKLVESALLEMCKSTGAKSIRTEAGTIIQGIKTQYWPADWAALHKFILANGAMELVQRRVSQDAMKTWIEENPDNQPPGLNIDNRYTITVRRAS